MSKFGYNNEKSLLASFSKLIALYDLVPDTKGCMEHIDKPKSEGGCGGWCCQIQSPQLMYCEFLRGWRYVLKHWDIKDIQIIIEAALRHYLNNQVIKGCIFWDKDTKMCRQHETRPLNCHLYGIFPKVEINRRVERLRNEYKDDPIAIFKDQCDLVSTANGEEVTEADTDAWFEKLTSIEGSIGISPNIINDDAGGTYRTYHDHIMIELFSDYQLENFSKVRQFGSQEEKESIIMTVGSLLSKAIASLKSGEDDDSEDTSS